MKLLLKDLEKKLPRFGTTDGAAADSKVVAKFFAPWTNWTWFVLEGERAAGDVLFFGLVCGFEEELGYFSLAELESVHGPFGLKIERDLHFGGKTLREAAPEFCERLWPAVRRAG